MCITFSMSKMFHNFAAHLNVNIFLYPKYLTFYRKYVDNLHKTKKSHHDTHQIGTHLYAFIAEE